MEPKGSLLYSQELSLLNPLTRTQVSPRPVAYYPLMCAHVPQNGWLP